MRAPPTRSLVLGEEYQHRFFWSQAARLLSGSRNVATVALEHVTVRAFDDVVTRYKAPVRDSLNRAVDEDLYQLKFRLKGRHAIRGTDLADPAFIGASKVSLLERIRDAHTAKPAVPRKQRMTLVTPWAVDMDDPLGELVSMAWGEIDVAPLLAAGPRTKLGKLRASWRNTLGGIDDDLLTQTLQSFRIRPTRMDEIDEALRTELLLAGLREVDMASGQHPYVSLSRGFVMARQLEHEAGGFLALMKKERLWVRDAPTVEPDRRALGIKSRAPRAVELDDAADSLSLLHFFRGRHKLSDVDWDADIAPAIDSFLEARVQSGQRYDLHLDCHLSIAYVAGRSVGKLPIAAVAPGQGREIWRISSTSADGNWTAREEPIGDGPELAVGIGASRDVAEAVLSFVRRCVPSVGRAVLLTVAGGAGEASVKSADHAVALAREAAREIGERRTDRDRGRPLHLFLATPAPLAFFLGREGRVFGPTTTYEFDLESGVRAAYIKAFQIGSGK